MMPSRSQGDVIGRDKDTGRLVLPLEKSHQENTAGKEGFCFKQIVHPTDKWNNEKRNHKVLETFARDIRHVCVQWRCLLASKAGDAVLIPPSSYVAEE